MADGFEGGRFEWRLETECESECECESESGLAGWHARALAIFAIAADRPAREIVPVEARTLWIEPDLWVCHIEIAGSDVLENPGRRAGLLYLIGSLPGFFSLLYVPMTLFVHGDPLATAHNLAAHETLFRCGIVADLLAHAFFIFVSFSLYYLLRDASPRVAVLIPVLLLLSIPIVFVDELNSVAALLLATGSGSLSGLDEPQRVVWMQFFLNLRGAGFDIAGIFWGLWLFPLGLCVYRSGFIPRILGAMLMVGCFAYLTNSFTSLVLPTYAAAVDKWVGPFQLVEMVFMLWLLIRGATPKERRVPARLA